MAVSDREQLKLGTIPLNDGIDFDVMGDSFAFTPAQLKLLWANNADADGDALVGNEQHYTPAYFDMTIATVPSSSTAEARTRLATLIAVLQACQNTEGGQALEWIPHGTEVAYTAYALAAEITDLPMTVEGNDAGWFHDAPIVRVRLTCKSFLHRPARVAKAAKESGAEPLQVLYVPEVGGDVAAEGEVILLDKSAQDRRHIELGIDQVEGESNPSLLLLAENLTTTGFAGAAATRSTAYGAEKVKRATAVSQATTIAGTGTIAHVGAYRVKARVYSGSTAVLWRLSYRDGQGQRQTLEWTEAPYAERFCEVDLGAVLFTQAELGTQGSEMRVEVMSTGTPIASDLNYIELIPTARGYGRIRGLSRNAATDLKAYDEFVQAAGNLDTKAMPLGGTWAMVTNTGANGWLTTGSKVKRNKFTDASLNAGTFGLAGTNKYIGTTVAADFNCSAGFILGSLRLGVLARYGSIENWVGAFFGWELYGAVYVYVIKRVAGVETYMTGTGNWVSTSWEGTLPQRRLTLAITPEGIWNMTCAIPGGAVEIERGGQDAVLSSVGALAEGRAGIYDACNAGAERGTREADNFSLIGSESAERALYSGRKGYLRTAGYIREDSTGTYDGPTSQHRGPDLYIPPAGQSDALTRLVTKLRRTDVDDEEDANVTDKHSTEVKVRERFLMPVS